jgi:hypothetical protein
MTVPFVNELRTADDVIVVNGDGAVLHLRVQAAELWDTVRVDAAESATVNAVKNVALQRFFPIGYSSPEFVVKLRGFEILNEDDTLAASGVRNGSTLLLASRRRRPVK